MSDLPATTTGCNFSEMGITYAGDVTFDQWAQDGAVLKFFHRALAFCWGDWLNYGESRFGETYSQALEASDYEVGTLRNAKWVSSRIPVERRIPTLGYGHHQAVAPLEPKDQDKWLERAAKNKWTIADLRRAMSGQPVEAKGVKALPPSKDHEEKLATEWWKGWKRENPHDILADSDRAMSLAEEAWLAGRRSKD